MKQVLKSEQPFESSSKLIDIVVAPHPSVISSEDQRAYAGLRLSMSLVNINGF